MNGLLGLTRNVNTTENAMRDLSILDRLGGRIEHKRNQEIEAQQAESLLMERMYQMSDTLLEKDRKRINKKFVQSQKQIQDHIRNSGGSRRSFMENGGLSVINNITNQLMRSDEAVQMQENRNNLARILEAKEKGLGHLISPTDLRSLEEYERNPEGGAISWSGIMNEVEMPPSQAFDYGKQITPEQILSYKGNLMKVKANYALSNPDKPDPNFEELTAFMEEMGYAGYGTNTTTMRMRYEEEVRRRRAAANKPTKKENDKNSYLGRMSEFMAWMPKGLNMQKIREEYPNGLIEGLRKEKPQLNKLIGEENKIMSRKRMLAEDGLDPTDISWWEDDSANPGERLFNEMYGLAESHQFAELLTPNIVKRIYGDDPEKPGKGFKIENNQIIGFDPSSEENLFKMTGEQITDDLKLEKDVHVGNYSIEGIYTALKGSKDDKDFLMMNAYDDNGDLDEKKTKQIHDGYEGEQGGSEFKYTTVLALRNAKTGDVYYDEIDITKPLTQNVLSNASGEDDNIKPVVDQEKESYLKMNELQSLSAQEQMQMHDTINTLEDSVFQKPVFEKEGTKYWGANSGGSQNRYDMMKAFYTAAGYMLDKNNPDRKTQNPEIYPTEVLNLMDDKLFTQSAYDGSIDDMLKDYSKNPEEIINHWLETANDENTSVLGKQNNQELAEKWLQVLSLMNE